jgi:hypothetical protein
MSDHSRRRMQPHTRRSASAPRREAWTLVWLAAGGTIGTLLWIGLHVALHR